MSAHKCGPACMVTVDIGRAALAAQPAARSIVENVHAENADDLEALSAAFETACVALATGASIMRRLEVPMDLIAQIVSSAVTVGIAIANAELRTEQQQQKAPAGERKVH